MLEESKEPLTQLADVPIEEYYHLALLAQVESRGGVCTRTGRKEYQSERYGTCVVYIYTIDFPKGTYRVMGERKGVAHRYNVHFPDGHIMNGSVVYRQNVQAGEKATVETLYPVASGWIESL